MRADDKHYIVIICNLLHFTQFVLNFFIGGLSYGYILTDTLTFVGIVSASSVFIIAMPIMICFRDYESNKILLVIFIFATAGASASGCCCGIGCGGLKGNELLRFIWSQMIWLIIPFILNIIILIKYNDQISNIFFHTLIRINICIQLLYLCLEFPYTLYLCTNVRQIITSFMSWIYAMFMMAVFTVEFIGLFLCVLQQFIITHDYEFYEYYQIIWYIHAVLTVFFSSTLFFKYYLQHCIPIKYLTTRRRENISLISWCIHDNLFYEKCVKQSEIMDRIYWIIHVSYHYYNNDFQPCLNYYFSIPGACINNKDNDSYIPIITSSGTQISSKLDLMSRHQMYDQRCIKYQNQFLNIDGIDGKKKYLKKILPYQSWMEYCCFINKCWFYIYVILKIMMIIFVLFWFGYVYIYQINGNKLNKYWILSDIDHFEHLLMMIIMIMYGIAVVIVCVCIYDVIGCEYYYGFVRYILMRDELINRLVTNYLNIPTSYDAFKTNQDMIQCLRYVGFPQDVAVIILQYL